MNQKQLRSLRRRGRDCAVTCCRSGYSTTPGETRIPACTQRTHKSDSFRSAPLHIEPTPDCRRRYDKLTISASTLGPRTQRSRQSASQTPTSNPPALRGQSGADARPSYGRVVVREVASDRLSAVEEDDFGATTATTALRSTCDLATSRRRRAAPTARTRGLDPHRLPPQLGVGTFMFRRSSRASCPRGVAGAMVLWFVTGAGWRRGSIVRGLGVRCRVRAVLAVAARWRPGCRP